MTFLDAEGRAIRAGDVIVHISYPETYYTVDSYCERSEEMRVSWGKRVIRTGSLNKLQSPYYKIVERKQNQREFEWMEVWAK